MSPLLGEMLVKQRIITEVQLEEGINSQVIFGGRLGTNLLELGYIDEPTLCKFLSDKHGVPYIDLRGRVRIDEEAIKLIPRKIADKLKAVPLKLENRTLHLVLLDPSDLDAVEEIKFLTGKNLNIFVAPEVRVYALLEKVYGIKRDIRFITLSRRDTQEIIREHKAGQQPPALQKEVVKKPVPKKPATEKTVKEPLPEELKPLKRDEELTTPEEFMKTEAQLLSAERAPDKLGEHEVIRDLPVAEEEIIELTDVVVEEEKKIPALTFKDAMNLLEVAQNRDEVAKSLLGFCMSRFSRAVLFTVQKGRVLPWDCLGENIDRHKVLKSLIPLTQPSIFKLVYDTKCHFLGPVPNIMINDEFLRRLSKGRPASALLMPVIFKGNLVLMIYGDSGEDEYVSTDIGEIMILAQKVPLIFENLIKRRKQMFKTG